LFLWEHPNLLGILDTILKNNHEVVGVITAADKPAGRGQKLKYSAVKSMRWQITYHYYNL
jgi:methionyl-tRNA formyltransferase